MLTLDNLAETSEVGGRKMPDFEAVSAYAVSQGWLVAEGNTLMLRTPRLAAS